MKLIANPAAIDQQAIQCVAGPSAEILMENAGRAVAETLLQHGGAQTHGVVLCGPGNNGGDGLVCARYLRQGGVTKVTVITTGGRYRREALKNLERLASIPVEVLSAETQTDLALQRIAQADFIVDALFGSGLNRPVGSQEATLIEAVNAERKSHAAVWALDMPSGIDGATGQVLGCAVYADDTITLATAKPGLYLQPGKAHAGRVHVADIGIPAVLIEADDSPLRLITTEQAKIWLPLRKPDSHKYDYGHVLVIAGSRQMPGAAMLCAEAAMNSGAGLVTLAAPDIVFEQLQLIPEVMRLPLGAHDHLHAEALPRMLDALSQGKYHAVVMGPGLGLSGETIETVLKLLEALTALPYTVVMDADALNVLSREPQVLNERFILTPHVGEASRLLGQASPDLLHMAQAMQARYQAQIVLKSASTVIAGTDGLIWVSPAGNAGMATAGSGDVLSGIIASQAAQYTAQKRGLEKLAPFGVYLHGLAGDQAALNLTPHAMRASDITYHLPDAFRKLMDTDKESGV